MLTLITAAALAATTASTPAPLRTYDVDPRTLRTALEAPESERRSGERPRYCVISDVKLAANARKVCRTWGEWVALGVRPVRS